VSTENSQKNFLKLYAYSTLANFMVTLGSKGMVDEDEAKSLLKLQNDLIKEFEATLANELDSASMHSFKEFVNKYRVRID
jgi:hypothetical protein